MRVLGLALLALVFPASAAAELRDTYTELAQRKLRPAPLVFTTAPKSLRPLERTVVEFGTPRGYGLRLVGPDAVIAFTGGVYKSMAAAFKDARRLGFSKRPTRVRGRQGYVMKRSRELALWWTEDKRIYTLATGTLNKVSLAGLHATADALDHLGIERYGSGGDPDNPSGGFVVTTERTVTAYVEFGAPACRRAGQQSAVLVPRQGNTFSFPITGPWSGTVSGTIGASSIALTVHATGIFDGVSCDTGVQQLTLDQSGSA